MKSTRILNDYKVIYRPEHPKAMTSENWLGYVYEHILVAEESIGRPIRKGEVVHHLNGKRNDNRKTNLLVIEHSQHAKLHAWLDNGAPYEGTLRINSERLLEPRDCLVCGITVQGNHNNKYCSSKCSSIGQRVVDRPSKEQLKLEISNSSWVFLGKKYGVSDNAVRKWAKRYGLIEKS